MHKVFLLEESFKNNMTKVFGYRHDFLAHRIYHMFSKSINFKRIYFPRFMEVIYHIINGTEEMK